AVVFVHGCFWHRCPNCAAGRKIVRSNVAYWRPKLERNVARDFCVKQELIERGWKVFTIWECQTRHAQSLAKLAEALVHARLKLTRSKAYPKAPRRQSSPRPPAIAPV